MFGLLDKLKKKFTNTEQIPIQAPIQVPKQVPKQVPRQKTKRQKIQQLFSQDVDQGDINQLYRKLQEAVNNYQIQEIVKEAVGAKRAKKFSAKCVEIMNKQDINIPPSQMMCHELRKKGLKFQQIEKAKNLFNTGQKFALKSLLNRLLGEQCQELFNKYQNNIKQSIKKPIPNSKFLFKQKDLQIYKYSEKGISAGQKNTAKTFMVLGETGSGKSTFLNAIVNYFAEVEVSDPFRYIIIDQDTSNQTKSITKQINTYYVKNNRTGKVYRLIDTPGFGDTSGFKADQDLVKKIQQKFKKQISEIDCVLFVIKSSNTRLNSYQNYIFQSVLSLFGKDVAKNFCFILTFSDAGDPQVLPALKLKKQGFGEYWDLIPKPKYICVNNGTFFQQVKLDDPVFIQYWNIGIYSMDKLVKRIQNCETVSLILTKQMIKTKEALSNQIRATRLKLDNLTNLQNNIKKQIQMIANYEDQINKNSNFTYNYDFQQWYGQMTDQNVTRCNNCQNTNCHEGCSYGNGQQKKDCVAMDNTGHCKICPKACHYLAHTNSHQVRRTRTVSRTGTHDILKQNYNKYKNDKSIVENALIDKFSNLISIISSSNEAHHKMVQLNEQLQKICMTNRRSQSLIEYIQFKIKEQNQYKSTGYKQRVEQLQFSLKQAKIHEQYAKGRLTMSKEQLLKQLKQDRIKSILKTASPSLYKRIKQWI